MYSIAGGVTAGLIGFGVYPGLAAAGGGYASGYAACGTRCGEQGAMYALAASVLTAELMLRDYGVDGEMPADSSSGSAMLGENTTVVVTGDRTDNWFWRVVAWLNDGFTHTAHSGDRGYWPTPHDKNYPRYYVKVQSNVPYPGEAYLPITTFKGLLTNNCTTRLGYSSPGTYSATYRYSYRTYWWDR